VQGLALYAENAERNGDKSIDISPLTSGNVLPDAIG
jgi:hypothetical protein